MVIQKQKKHDNGFESDIKRKIVKQSVLTSTEWYAETIMRTKKMVWLADSRITRVLARNTNACVQQQLQTPFLVARMPSDPMFSARAWRIAWLQIIPHQLTY
jgi:hypothetical protein